MTNLYRWTSAHSGRYSLSAQQHRRDIEDGRKGPLDFVDKHDEEKCHAQAQAAIERRQQREAEWRRRRAGSMFDKIRMPS